MQCLQHIEKRHIFDIVVIIEGAIMKHSCSHIMAYSHFH